MIIDRVTTVAIQAGEADEICYTLDGSVPSERSPLYEAPLQIEETTIPTARAFRSGAKPSLPSTTTFVKVDPATHGLHYAYYEGYRGHLPDFEKTNPQKGRYDNTF